MMTAGPIERNFIPHSTTLARGRKAGNRLGAGLGVGLAAVFGVKSLARSREAAKGANGDGRDLDMIYMMNMIFGVGVGDWPSVGA